MPLKKTKKEAIYKFNDGSIYNSSSFTIRTSRGDIIILGYNESTALSLLINNPNQHISRAELIDEIWGKRGIIVDDNSLTQCISRLRKQLKHTSLNDIITIKTIPKVGYQVTMLAIENNKEEKKERDKKKKIIFKISLAVISIITITIFSMTKK